MQEFFTQKQGADCLRELWRMEPDESIGAKRLLRQLKDAEAGVYPISARLWEEMPYAVFRHCLQVWVDVGWLTSPCGQWGPFTRRAIMLTPAGRLRWNGPKVMRAAGVNRDGSLTPAFFADPVKKHLHD